MFQGGKDERSRNEEPFPFAPQSLDGVLLTHAHIDHSGLLPKLVKDGFAGQIITTRASVSLAQLMLRDSAHIQESEAEWLNRKGKRAGSVDVEPLYTLEDAERCLERFVGVSYGASREVAPHITARFLDAGHILGSSIIELYVREEGRERKLVFSGDLGEEGRPIVADPTIVESADYLVMEATYGNRLHEETEKRREKIRDIILLAVKDREKVIIPAFAVGRTQDVLYEINGLYRDGQIPLIPVYIDSPLAISVTEVFRQYQEDYDEEMRALLKRNMSPFDYPGLRFTRTVEESKALNESTETCVIISASGMCEAGRIKHHLKHSLWREGAHILFVGYQAEGTLGRRIKDGANKVNILGEEIAVRANIHSIEGLSAHADRAGLFKWVSGIKNQPQAIFITHGEATPRAEFAALLHAELGLRALVPSCGEQYDLREAAVLVTTGTRQAAPPKAADELERLWRRARQSLARALQAGTRREAREAQRLTEKLENLLRKIVADEAKGTELFASHKRRSP
jgi:metallo-beta-lactamase family protein